MASGNKVAALVLNLPGAPDAWHVVVGLPGLYHPEVARPVENAQGVVSDFKKRIPELQQAWEEFEAEQEAAGRRPNGQLPFEEPPTPVKLVNVSQTEAKKGEEAHAAAVAASRNAIRLARRGSREEQALAESEAAAITGGEGE